MTEKMTFLSNLSYKNRHKVQFFNIWPTLMEGVEPTPANKVLPQWFKRIPAHNLSGHDLGVRDKNNATVKKCMPFFDAMTAGYIIPLPADVWVTTDLDGQKRYHWADDRQKIVDFHNVEQVLGYPLPKGDLRHVPKFVSPWRIVTPRGYSLLYMTPLHRDLPFKIIEGIVDTDVFTNTVNFPFVLKDTSFEGMIPAGTPMVQVIPLRRENWFHDIEMDYSKSEAVLDKFWNSYNSHLVNFYKRVFWVKKQYR